MNFRKIFFVFCNFIIGLALLSFLGIVFFCLAAFVSALLSPIIISESFDTLLIFVSFILAISCTIKIAMMLHAKHHRSENTEELPEYAALYPPEDRLKITYKDDLFPQCVEIVLESGIASVGRFQSRLKIGSIRAESIFAELEEQGIIGPQEWNRQREVFITWDQWKNAEKIHVPQDVAFSRTPAQRCINCGEGIDHSAKFCSSCGHATTQKQHTILSSQNNRRPYYARNCARCGNQDISYETVVESNQAGCMVYFLYFILALTLFGLLIVIPLMLRPKTKTITYAVCQNCGRRWRVY